MDNMDKLVEMVTAEIIRRMSQQASDKILVLGKDSNCPIAGCLQSKFDAAVEPNLDNVDEYGFVVLPVGYLNKLLSRTTSSEIKESTHADTSGAVLDLTHKKLIHEREIMEKCSAKISTIQISKKAIVTQLAADLIKKHKITIVRVD